VDGRVNGSLSGLNGGLRGSLSGLNDLNGSVGGSGGAGRLGGRPEALIFDMDGTLFQTETVAVPAYLSAFEKLREEGTIAGGEPRVKELLASLGMLLEAIWRRVLPDEPEAVRARMNEVFLEEQMALLARGAGRLYPGVAETLRLLKDAGCRLFVASNGLERYVKGVAERTGIAPLFEGLYSAGEFRTTSKTQLVALLLRRHGLLRDGAASAWMVGDRSSDVEAGRANGLPVVGCAYAAFGVSEDELRGADVRISRFAELAALFEARPS